jgi:uncharacterized protein (TIGR02453 family)
MAARCPGFPPAALKFLQQLKRNNNREWFLSHKPDYEEVVKGPLHTLVLALGEDLLGYAPGFEIEPRKAIYRIYRDVRFARDKSPFKTHVAAIFHHRRLQKHRGAGFYFHLSPEELFVAGGVYLPASEDLLKIRRRLSTDAQTYRKLIKSPGFRKYFPAVEGASLKRPPKGFSADDPALDLLRQKQFLVSNRLSPEIAVTPRLIGVVNRRYRAMAPWISWLNEPLL